MLIYNKKSLLILSLFLALPVSAVDQPVEDYSSGRSKVTAIMSNDETGIAAYNKKNIRYAEAENLAADLNIEQIAKFFGCKTLIGQAFITETLKFPVSKENKDSVLANRQNAIKTLVENPALKAEVEKLLIKAQQEEQEVIKLMSEFFKGRTCPDLKQLELIKKQNPEIYPYVEFLTCNPEAKTVVTAFSTVSIGLTAFASGYLGKTAYELAQVGLEYKELALNSGYLALLSGLQSYALYKDYSFASDKRSKMHALNQLIVIAERFEKLCIEYGIKNQFTISTITSSEGKELIEKLKHARYQEKDTKIFLTPLVHTFLYKLYQQDKQLAQVLACVAELDAYNAIATKMIESQHQKNKFCFVSLLENDRPVIRGQQFWNVLVENAVPNSIEENKQIILTGPNAGGKTTNIRTILQNIIFGQCFGVAAAEKFEFTPFDVIHSYLHISDDILQGKSLFASEIKRAQDILQKIKSLEPGKKFFFALDELFTGTVAEDGETCAYEFVKRIAEFKDVMFIYATHFDKLKELGKDNEFCTNYKVDAPTKNSDGKLVYPFTLSQGANEARVALDIAREANLFA